MAHDHGHSHNHIGSGDNQRRVLIAAMLTLFFMIVEVIGGLISGSLALLADAAHMLTDTSALMLAWLGYHLAKRPADSKRSFGWGRFRVLAAFVNGVTLIGLAIWIVLEAIARLLSPPTVTGELVLGVAIIGLVVNLVAFAILHRGHSSDLNMQGAVWHVAGDLFGSLAAILSAVIILNTGWMAIDPFLSVLVAAIVAIGGISLVRKTGQILLEAVPHNISIPEIKADIESYFAAIVKADHIHAWSIDETRLMLTLDIVIVPDADAEQVRIDVKDRLKTRFNADHVTVEIIQTTPLAGRTATASD